MRCKAVNFVFLAFLVLTAFASVSEAKTIYVPDDYEKIQWAVDNASAGDTIIVRDGIYYEHVNVNKQLTLKSENGSANCIVDARYSGSPITLYADGISIEGLTLRNSSWLNAGIEVYSNNNSITDNYISNNWDGIYLYYSSNNSIIDNYISSNNDDSIYLYSSSNNSIIDNNISNNEDGIFLWYSSNNSITDNYISSNNEDGIFLKDSSNNSITDNYISSNNLYGISLGYSSNNHIRNNIFIDDGVVIVGDELKDWNTHVIENNTVNGRPLYYFKDRVGGKVPEDAGQVILANCTGFLLENLNISNTNGIIIGFSSQNIITNNNISSNNVDGIDLDYSSNNRIAGNNISSNNWEGIFLWYSSNNSITDNYISNNWRGIFLLYSGNNRITDNYISSNNWCGISLRYSSNNNSITDNYISSNNEDGIYLWWDSSNNSITSNYISSNNDDGISLWYSSNNRITDNYISSNNEDGIYLCFSGNNSITDNNIPNNDDGIYLWYSSNNRIAGNNISSNNWYGIYLEDSSNNSIYLNNFIDNKDNVYSYASANIWNSTEEMTYTYNGKTYTSYLGNYWSDYTGSDADEDGIGDTPYIIDSDKDNYPLMERFENYIVTPIPNQPPVANFTYYPEKPVVNQSVTFDASSSYDPDGKIMNYEWDFGDGNITNTTEEVISHSYSEAGIYEVTLTVTDDDGAKNSTTKMITVVPAPPSVSISTDKYEYTAGDVMLINITFENPRNERQNVKFLWRLDISDYNLSFKVINNKSLLLPPGFKKTFVISWRLPKLRASFNASWYVALYSDGVISEDTADWRYVGKKGGGRDIAIAEYLREIERSGFLAALNQRDERAESI